jgi:NAD dependent epimerase/dehydratase
MAFTSIPSPVLITGAGGFIGSHLTELCVERGLAVRAFVHYNAENRWGWLDYSAIKADIEVVRGDVRDYDSVYRAMQGCRSVLHLAALIGIPHSYVSPLAYVRTNVEGTYNVLEAARQLNLERIAVTSTSETYGTAQCVPIPEDHPAVGQSPYAATKIGADALALSYFRAFGLPVHVVRPFNTYGPRQSARAFIPTVATQILAGERSISAGNLHPTRDFTFVRDAAAGYLAVVASDALVGSATNIGMNHEISMAQLVETIAGLCGAQVEVVESPARVRPAPSEVGRLVCDNSRIRTYTDWLPDYDLERGLAETLAFLRQHLSLYRPGVYNV